MAEPSSKPAEELFFTSHNETRKQTIVLLHGLFSSHLEWDHVIPHLTSYHLLIPDHASHSKSTEISPFTLTLAADSVASLIRNHAHDARAHLVGLSLGGFVTLELIRRAPECVIDAFVTGCAPFTPWQIWFARRPSLLRWGFHLAMNSGLYRVAEKFMGLREHDALKRELLANCSYELARDGYGSVAEFQDDEVRLVARRDKRICVVAGGHGDNVEGTTKMGEILRELSGDEGGRGCSEPGGVGHGCYSWVELAIP